MLFRFLFGLAMTVLAGAAVGYITYKVCGVISRSNLGERIRSALQTIQEEWGRRLLAKELTIAIGGIDSNKVRINLSAADEEDHTMILEGERVDEDLYEGYICTSAA